MSSGLKIQLSTFSRNLIAYGLSEVTAKASRLLVVVAIARSMNAAEIGIAAAALAGGDILKSFTETGVNQRIMSAPNDRLEATAATASRIFWIWTLGLFGVQNAIAAFIYQTGGSVPLAAMLSLLSLEYLFMPAGLVQAALAMRAGKLRQTAMISAGQISGANIVTAILAIFWPGPLALVLPRIIAAPFWLVAMRRLHPWQRDRQAGFAPLKPFLKFGCNVLGIELLKAVRLHADKLIIGAVAGAEVLGQYFMAFNAGLSIATSFSAAFSVVLFPHLATASDRNAVLQQAVVTSLLIMGPIILLQAVLAPVYVPVLFGAQWEHLGGVVSILCLAAIPAILWSSAAGWLRAHDQSGQELKITFATTALLAASTFILADDGLIALSMGYLAASVLTQVGGSLPVLAKALPSRRIQVA